MQNSWFSMSYNKATQAEATELIIFNAKLVVFNEL